MSMYLWCEDSKSGFKFWQAIFRQILPEMNVETKESNSGLRKAVCRIKPDENEYYILMDMAMDNPDVLRERKYMDDHAKGKRNIHIIRLHSFEFVLLSFERLEEWVFAKEDELKERRHDLLKARSVFVENMTSDAGEAAGLATFKAAFDGYESKNSEQRSAKLLYEITRNTGFETSKAELGACFVNSCCEWVKRQSDDACGLDAHRISAHEKARLLVKHSPMEDAFRGVGL